DASCEYGEWYRLSRWQCHPTYWAPCRSCRSVRERSGRRSRHPRRCFRRVERIAARAAIRGEVPQRIAGQSTTSDSVSSLYPLLFTRPELLAQLAFEDFAGAGLGKLLRPKVDGSREFEFAETLLKKFEEAGFVKGRTLLQYDEGHGDFTPLGIG